MYNTISNEKSIKKLYNLVNQGVTLKKTGKQYSTQTCPKCGHRHKPLGRTYQCKNLDCDFIGVRDLVGAANIKNEYENEIIKPNHAF